MNIAVLKLAKQLLSWVLVVGGAVGILASPITLAGIACMVVAAGAMAAGAVPILKERRLQRQLREAAAAGGG